MAMGGRIAEELVFDEMSTGAANDIEQATETGPRDGLPVGHERASSGPWPSAAREGEVFLGRDFSSRPDYSEETARQIDAEVREIVMSCYERAKKLLSDNFDTLKRIADGAASSTRRSRRTTSRSLVQGGTITRDRPEAAGQRPAQAGRRRTSGRSWTRSSPCRRWSRTRPKRPIRA